MKDGFVSFELPFPAKILWPNGRGHWAAKAKAFKEHKAWAFYGLKAMLGPSLPHTVKDGEPVDWAVTVHPKTANRVDDDNARASLKAYQDGLAQALGVDDSWFRPPSLAFGEPVKGGKVIVWVKVR